jgi:hypothetical protein
MLDRTSVMAWLYAATGRFCAAMAAEKASMTVPSSRTVVPAMSRQATVMRLMRTSPLLWPGHRSCPARLAR